MEKSEHGGDIYANTGVWSDFSVNTNPLGMPKEVKRALIARVDEFARYPDTKCRKLREAIAQYENIPADWILCGNGAADLIYRLCYAIKPRKALIFTPAFSEYERALEQVGCLVTRRILTNENAFAFPNDADRFLAPDIDCVFLCNPNNPTGRLIPSGAIERVLNRARQNGAKVVVDECFLDFTRGAPCKEYLREMPNLALLKAFTKMYAIAGLRLGYLICADIKLTEKVKTAGDCWNVSVPAQIAGVAALTRADWADKTRRFIRRERAFLTKGLSELKIAVFPSDANFLLLRCEKPLFEPLLKKGILIRRCENFIGLDDTYYRIGVKTRPENTRLLEALKEILNG